MGVIYLQDGFRKATIPIKVIKGQISSGEIDESVLENYATKDQLEEVKNNIDTHAVTEESLIIN